MDGNVIDRLISGAGAVAAGADDWGRGFGEAEPRMLRRNPAAVPIAILLFVLGGLLLLVGIETTAPPTAGDLRAGDLAGNDGLGQRTYATVSGSLASTFVADVYDGDDTNDAWFYLLVDPTTRRGITVRSDRPPSEVFTSQMRGVVVEDADYVRDDIDHFKEDTTELGLTLDPKVYIDATAATGDSAQRINLSSAPPAAGTSVEVSGSRLVDYGRTCVGDPNGDGRCDDAEANGFDVIVYDPVTKRAITVLTRTSPAFTEATVTGMLTRNELAVDEAKGSDGFRFGDDELDVSPHYLLDDGTTPPDSVLAFLLAAGLGLLGGVILVGSAGGYLVFHPTRRRLAEPATTLVPGERLPLRVTGFIHTPHGRVHVREVSADLVRFILRPATAGAEAGIPEVPATTTLVVERTGHPHGVSVGLGELVGLSVGDVVTLRGQRPALAAVAGTGRLVLSFDSVADRDRAAAELLDESGLGSDEQPAMAGQIPVLA
jgi:hypothetical protein